MYTSAPVPMAVRRYIGYSISPQPGERTMINSGPIVTDAGIASVNTTTLNTDVRPGHLRRANA